MIQVHDLFTPHHRSAHQKAKSDCYFVALLIAMTRAFGSHPTGHHEEAQSRRGDLISRTGKLNIAVIHFALIIYLFPQILPIGISLFY